MILINLFNLAGCIVFCLCMAGLLLHVPFSLYLRCRRTVSKEKPPLITENGAELFHVIQLPVYNENPEMVASLLRSGRDITCCRERFCIQLLDDSNIPQISSQLRQIVAQINREQPDLQLIYLHRDDRQNFKAGNLNYGLQQLQTYLDPAVLMDSSRVIVSIFDADFQIPPNYLQRISGHFAGEAHIGIVQANTSFRNSDANLLTKAQTIFQNNLQNNEFSARSGKDHLSTFRGSAGSLRLLVIEECGYWQGDTQIEDTDLSFLAQARGWKIAYDNKIACSSLLPESYNEYKLQQRSWVKGLMEVMRKRIGQVLSAKSLTAGQKLGGLDFFFILSLQTLYMTGAHLSLIPAHAFWCLFAPSLYFSVFLAFLLLLFISVHIPLFVYHSSDGTTVGEKGEYNRSGLLLGTFSFFFMIAMFPTFTVGVIEGLFGRKVYRHRTGKGDSGHDSWDEQGLPPSSITILRNINMFEIAMAVYSILFVAWALGSHLYFIGVLYSLFAVTYPVCAVISFREIQKM